MFGPIIYSFFVNTAIIVIATHFTFGEHVGLTNFGSFLDEATRTNQVMKYLWGLALFSGSQSSCATATATGEVCDVEFIPEYVQQPSLYTRSLRIYHLSKTDSHVRTSKLEIVLSRTRNRY